MEGLRQEIDPAEALRLRALLAVVVPWSPRQGAVRRGALMPGS